MIQLAGWRWFSLNEVSGHNGTTIRESQKSCRAGLVFTDGIISWFPFSSAAAWLSRVTTNLLSQLDIALCVGCRSPAIIWTLAALKPLLDDEILELCPDN